MFVLTYLLTIFIANRTIGVRHGCSLSPDVFNMVLEVLIRLVREKKEAELKLCGRQVNNLRFTLSLSSSSFYVILDYNVRASTG